LKHLAFVSGLQLFPPQSGGQLRSAGLAKALAHHGFQVEVYSLIGRSAEYRARRPSELVVLGPNLTEYVDRRPAKAALQFASYRVDVPPVWISEYLRFRLPPPLAERLERADAVIADFPFLARVFHKTHKPRVLNTHNIEQHLVPGGGMKALVRARVKQLEDEAAREADVVCCCAQGDADYFRAAGSRQVLMVPNGIDVTRFEAARGQRAATRRALGVADDEALFLFPASKFGPNKEAYDWLVHFLEDHAGEVARRKARFCVVGSVVDRPEEHGPLKATGRVPEVEPYFAAADFALNPMFSGAGTNVKMADFIAARLPILTTGFGARGFELQSGKSALFFEPESFLACLDEALATPHARREALAGAAYEANAKAIDMNHCVQPLVDWLNARG
jgi:Glycosyltransferase Family 4/Glycosyl transferases group 1